MTSWPAERVLRASAEWVSIWYPPQAVHRDEGWLEFYLVGSIATVMRVDAENRKAAVLVPQVLAEVRRHGAKRVLWKVGPGRVPAGTDQILLGLGGSVDTIIDICAYPLGGPLPPAADSAATARTVRTRDDVACFERTTALAWGYPEPTEADIDRTYAQLGPGYFLGYWKDRPAGAGGYGLAGEVARFWGAAVVAEFRGRGVYRALVRERMADAGNRGGTLALVHANAQTSSPILQRLGFGVYGQQRTLDIRADAA